MTIAFAERMVISPDVHMLDLQGESVFLNLTGRRYFGLDEVGTRMWQVLTSSESIEAAYNVLLAEYDVEAEHLRRDLQGLVENLVRHGLAQVGTE